MYYNFKYGIFGLIRHSHPPFLKMAAVLTNVAISDKVWYVELLFWHQWIDKLIAISNVSNISHLTLIWPSQPPFNKMAAVKSNCLYIFKTRYLEGYYTDTFSIYAYIGVVILNSLLLDLDRHSHPPFLKMAAVFINVAISYQIWHPESWFCYQCIDNWIAISNS